MIPLIRFMVVVLICSWAAPSPASQDFGVILDVTGEGVISRNGKKMSAEIGQEIVANDSIAIGANSVITLASYMCIKWTVRGPEQIDITPDKDILLRKQPLPSGEDIPICFNPEDFREINSLKIGGRSLRPKKKDLVSDLRKEVRKGEASNSALLTIIIHDLRDKKNGIAKAMPYFEELKKRLPDNMFVNELSKTFEQGSAKGTE